MSTQAGQAQIYDEALEGRLYTALQFAETFENKAGLGGSTTIRERLSVLATKGYLRFLRDATPFGYAATTSRFGYLVVEDMQCGPAEDSVDPQTGEITSSLRAVLPSHFKSPQTGAVLEVENPLVWTYAEDEEP